MTVIAPTGATGKNAFGIGSAWGTEVAATDLLVDVWMSMKEATPNLNYPKGAGSMYKRSANPMECKADVDIKGPFSITQFEKLLKIFHGQHYRSSAVETTAYKHSYWLKDSASGFISTAQHGGGGTVAAKVCDSAFLNTLKISGKDGDTPLEIELKGIGRRLMRSPGVTTTNTPTTIDALTAPGVDAYEKKVTLIHGSTASGLNAGYFKVRRVGAMAASTAVVTSGGGGNATRGAVTFATTQGTNAWIPVETITVTFETATTFTASGSVSGDIIESGTLGVLATGTLPAAFGRTGAIFTVTLTAGASPMSIGDTIVWTHYYNSTGTDTAFNSSDVFYPTSFDFSVDKKMKGMASGDRYISLGSTEDQRDVKLKFAIPSYEGTANDISPYVSDIAYCLWRDMQYQQAGTIFYYKLDCYFEMPQLAGAISQKYYLRLTIPRAALRVPDWNMTGPGLLPINLEFEVLQPFTVPTDFSGFANSTTDLYPYGLELCNKLSTDT